MLRRILVTGAQGFVGRYTAACLLRAFADSRVLGIGRSDELTNSFTHSINLTGRAVPAPLTEASRSTLASDRYEYNRVDVLDERALTQIISHFRPTVVIHLAAVFRDAPVDQLLTLNARAISCLYAALGNADVTVDRIVVASPAAVHGDPERFPGAQRNAHRFDRYCTARPAEDVARMLSDTSGIATVVSRIGHVVGPGQDEHQLCGSIARQLCNPAQRRPAVRVADQAGCYDFIDVRDVARALTCLADRGEAGQTYDIGSGVWTTTAEVLDLLCQIANVPGPRQAATEVPGDQGSPTEPERLRLVGFEPEHTLAQSLEDLYSYYCDLTQQAGHTPGGALEPLQVRVTRDHQYRIEVAPNLLERLPEILTERYQERDMVILTDTRVWDLYGHSLATGLQAAGVRTADIVIPDGQVSRDLHVCHDIIEQLYHNDVDRSAVLINLGGGLVTDIGGFVAGTYLSGVSFVNVPTTLLAQHAALGGRVSLNTTSVMNALTAVHHPEAVFADPATLRTLTPRQLASGLAHAIKLAVIRDAGFFEQLEAGAGGIVHDHDAAQLEIIVARAAAIRVQLLRDDPWERDTDTPLNFGQTFAHALLTEYGFTGLLDGEALAWGMAVATAIAHSRRVLDDTTAERIFRLIAACGLPPVVPGRALEAALGHIQCVRMMRGGRLHVVLPTGLGTTDCIDEVSAAEFHSALETVCDHPAFFHPHPQEHRSVA